MKKYVIVLTGLVVVFSLLGIAGNLRAADPNKPKAAHKTKEVSVTGTVSAIKDSQGNITEVKVKTAKGVTYDVTLNEKGKEMGQTMADKKVKAEGTTETKNRAKWLTVEKFSEPVVKSGTKHQPKAPETNKTQ